MLFAGLGAIGVLFGLPNIYLHIPLLSLLFPFSLYVVAATAPDGRQAFLRGWLVGFFTVFAGLYWIALTIHDFTRIHILFAVAFGILCIVYHAIFIALASLAIYSFSRLARVVCKERFCFLFPVLFGGLAYGGFEALSNYFSTTAWLTLSTAFAFQPAWIQTASLIGASGLSVLFVTVSFLFAAACLIHGKQRTAAFMIALGILLVIFCYGMVRLGTAPQQNYQQALSLIMVQGNVDMRGKWDRENQNTILDHYLTLSTNALLEDSHAPSVDLVLWPENAVTFPFEHFKEAAQKVKHFASYSDVYLAIGAPAVRLDIYNTSKIGFVNRLRFISPKGNSVGHYDKERLLPFGEYIPSFWAIASPFLRRILGSKNSFAGVENTPMRLQRYDGSEVTLGGLICFESAFAYLAQARVEQGVEILINVSDDGWLGKTSGPMQSFAHAVLRSVEQSRSTARSANTGVTAAIDSYGRIIARIDGLFVEGVLYATLEPSQKITIYHRIHYVLEKLLMGIALLSLFCCWLVSRNWFTRRYSSNYA
jgi:apolipoprotein N-acyltransferase